MLEKNFETLYLLFRSNYYQRFVEKIGIKEGSLSATESHCVEIIHLLGKPTVSDFAQYLNISVPNANYKINSLVRKGYVEREQSKKDLREQYLCVTDKFLDYYGLNDAEIAHLMKRIRETFSPSDLTALDEMIQRIIVLMKTPEGGNKVIRIITDTASDITLKQAEEMNVTILPISVTFNSEPYNQLGDETFTEFYEKLENSEAFPMTSLISPGTYLDVFEEAKNKGESVVVIPISSQLSGSFQSAQLAKNMAEYDDIHIVDTRQVTIGQRVLVECAVRLRDEKKSAGEIAAFVLDLSKRIRLYASLDTLKYLVKGGRISKAAGFVGSTFNIKPLITLKDGAVCAAGKAKGRSSANTMLAASIEKDADFDPEFPFYFGYTANREQMDEFIKLAKEALTMPDITVHPIGGVIGTHVGPNAVAAIWVVKK